MKATARGRRPLGDGKRQESAERASWRGRVDVALLATLRDGLLRRSEAAALTWGDVEFRDNGSALLQLRRSKTDQEAEGRGTLRRQGSGPGPAGHQARDRAAGPQCKNLRDDRPAHRQPGQSGAEAAGLGEGYTGHSGRLGMAQDLVKSGVELPALMTAGRWKSSKMPARYTERQAADRGRRGQVLSGQSRINRCQ